MPDYSGSLVDLINGQVAAGGVVVTKMGTVQSRDTTGSRVMVAFDGSSGTPQPVKCFAGVLCDAGDRVGMAQFESDWIVVGSYTLGTLGTSATQFTWSSAQTTTSATYVDMPSSPTLPLLKIRDSTQIRMRVQASMYVTTAVPTSFKLGLRVTLAGLAVDYDQDVLHFNFNTASQHTTVAGTATTTGTLPAGNYTLTARWLRSGGTGTGNVDTQDSINIEAQEVTI